jgi:hypothetical protein
MNNDNLRKNESELIDIAAKAKNPVWANNIIAKHYTKSKKRNTWFTEDCIYKLVDVIAEGNNPECAFNILRILGGNDQYRLKDLARTIANESDPRWAYKILVDEIGFGSGIVSFKEMFLDLVISYGTPKMIAHILLKWAYVGIYNRDKIIINKAVDKIIASQDAKLAAVVRYVTKWLPLYYRLYSSIIYLLRRMSLTFSFEVPWVNDIDIDFFNGTFNSHFMIISKRRYKKLGRIAKNETYFQGDIHSEFWKDMGME